MGNVFHLTKVHEAKSATKFIFALLTDEQKHALTFLPVLDVTQTFAMLRASAVLALPMEQ
ncbi:hypothetical protein D3C76_1847670 [compost metagenome]